MSVVSVILSCYLLGSQPWSISYLSGVHQLRGCHHIHSLFVGYHNHVHSGQVRPNLARFTDMCPLHPLLCLVFRSLRSDSHGKILISLCLALLGIYLFFFVSAYATAIPVLCGISSGMLQYFMLAFFCWTAVETVFIFTKIVLVFTKITNYYMKAAPVAWRESWDK